MLEKAQVINGFPLLLRRHARLSATQAMLKRWAAIDEGDRVLDMDCHGGALLMSLLDSVPFNPCGIADTYADMMQARRNLPDADIMNCTPEDIAWRPEAFNVVLCGRTPGEMNNPGEVIAEVRRTLKPGGQFVWVLPSSLTALLTNQENAWNRARVNDLLKERGFIHIEWHGLPTRPVVIAFRET